MAGALQAPELVLTKDEANGLAKAAADVASHYPTTIDPKVLAWCNLAMAVGIVYGPRVYMISQRKSRRTSPPKQSAEVFNFGTPTTS